jgi:branched-chain amino acid transport system substrate-binding protein
MLDKRQKVKWLIGSLLLVTLLVSMIIGCAPAAPAKAPSTPPATTPATPAAPGPVEGTVKMGAALALSGPMAATFAPMGQAVSDYVTWVNSQGGVAGHKYEVSVTDCAYDIAKETAAYKKERDLNNVSSFWTTNGGAALLLAPMSMEDKIVCLGNPEPGALFMEPQANSYWFPNYPTYYQFFITMIRWLKANDWKGTGSPRVGVFNADSATGRTSLKGINEGLKRVGWDAPVVVTWAPNMVTDATTQAQQIKDAKVDYVLSYHLDAGTMQFLKDCQRLGVTAKLASWWIPFNKTVMDGTAAINYMTAKGQIFGFDTPHLWSETDVKGIQIIREWNKKARPEVTWQAQSYMNTVSQCALNVEAYTRAIQKYGYANVKGPQLKEAYESIKDWSWNGLHNPVTLGPDVLHHFQITTCRIETRDGPNIVPVSDFLPIEPLTEQETHVEYWK